MRILDRKYSDTNSTEHFIRWRRRRERITTTAAAAAKKEIWYEIVNCCRLLRQRGGVLFSFSRFIIIKYFANQVRCFTFEYLYSFIWVVDDRNLQVFFSFLPFGFYPFFSIHIFFFFLFFLAFSILFREVIWILMIAQAFLPLKRMNWLIFLRRIYTASIASISFFPNVHIAGSRYSDLSHNVKWEWHYRISLGLRMAIRGCRNFPHWHFSQIHFAIGFLRPFDYGLEAEVSFTMLPLKINVNWNRISVGNQLEFLSHHFQHLNCICWDQVEKVRTNAHDKKLSFYIAVTWMKKD